MCIIAMNAAQILKINGDKITQFATSKHVPQDNLFIQAWVGKNYKNPNGEMFQTSTKVGFESDCMKFRQFLKATGNLYGLNLVANNNPVGYVNDLWLCDVELERTPQAEGELKKQLTNQILKQKGLKS